MLLKKNVSATPLPALRYAVVTALYIRNVYLAGEKVQPSVFSAGPVSDDYICM